MLTLVTVGAASFGGWRVSQSEFLDVDQMLVDGAFGSEADQVREASGLVLGEPMVSTDLAQAASNVTSLAWVADAVATREWRATVRIDVVRRIPYVAVPDANGTFVILDDTAVAMRRVDRDSVGELPIVGVVAEGELGEVEAGALPGLLVVAAMPSDVHPWVEQILVRSEDTESAILGLTLIGGATVELGDSRLLTDKFEALRSVLAGAVLPCILNIDLRVADLAPIVRADNCVVELPEAVEP